MAKGMEACLPAYRRSARLDRQSTGGQGEFPNYKTSKPINPKIPFDILTLLTALFLKNKKGGDIIIK
jgi:hypothetical protein